MNTNMFALASALSDHDLLDRLGALAGTERETTAELVAHLAALDARPSLYAAQGHGSLFSYCRRALRLSEDAASNRIEAARTCRRFPAILDLLASGDLSLSAIRMLQPCLTAENHETVLARARGRSRPELQALIAELAPRPDVPSSVRKLPTVSAAAPTSEPAGAALPVLGVAPAGTHASTAMAPTPDAPLAAAVATSSARLPPARRPIIETTSPDRYRVQFTIGKETHEKLRRLQALLRREIPTGDPGLIFDRAVTLLLEKVEKTKLGAATRPRSIRPRTDRRHSRHVPNQSKRVSWQHDAGQCAFVAPNGQRCSERAFLEFHHVKAYALGGPATPDNISLRCRRHNQYEAEVVFGSRVAAGTRAAGGQGGPADMTLEEAIRTPMPDGRRIDRHG